MEYIRSLLPAAIFGAAVSIVNFTIGKVLPVGEWIRHAFGANGWDAGSGVPGGIQLAMTAPLTSYLLGMSGYAQYAAPGSLWKIGAIAGVYSATLGHMVYWRISDWFKYRDENLAADLFDGFSSGLLAYMLAGMF